MYRTPRNATGLQFNSMVWSDERTEEELAEVARTAGRFLARYFKREKGIAKAGSASKGWADEWSAIRHTTQPLAILAWVSLVWDWQSEN
eukprot:COSAG05_NODE_3569_length_1986_cov_2.229995_1_plen_89_part_00